MATDIERRLDKLEERAGVQPGVLLRVCFDSAGERRHASRLYRGLQDGVQYTEEQLEQLIVPTGEIYVVKEVLFSEVTGGSE